MDACMHTYAHTHACTYIRHTHSLTHTHTHTHTQAHTRTHTLPHTLQGDFAPNKDLLAVTLQQLRRKIESLKGARCADPLEWWRTNTATASTLSVLAPLARMYFALPASSADLERSFSSAGFILEGRQRLLVRNLETQAVVRDYLIELERLCDSRGDYITRVRALVSALQAVEVEPEGGNAAAQPATQPGSISVE